MLESTGTKENLVEVVNVTKVYPGTVALKDFSVRITGGKVHALIGKNGSGKSTTVKVLSGAIRPTEGTVRINGHDVSFTNPREASEKGIATVYQELSLVPALSVTENLLLGRLPRKGWAGHQIDWAKARRIAQDFLSELELDFPLDSPVGSLSVGQQQVLEIAKAMSANPVVLILDEPTSALARHETSRLFEVVTRLRNRGVAVLYITHRLHELYQIADEVSVLRDGALAGTVDIKSSTPQQLVELMFGEVEKRTRPDDLMKSDEPVLRVQGLGSPPHFSNISFDLMRGEVLGIAGMMGSGRSELLRAIFHADPYVEGSVTVAGTAVPPTTTPEGIKRLGLGMTPENRKSQGLILDHSVLSNITLAAIGRTTRRGLRDKSLEKRIAKHQIDALQITASDIGTPVASLSGGNQQKVVVGNWLNNQPRIMIFDEPTRGIDVNAKQQIFQIIWDLSRNGISSIVVSSELEELVEVCQRILIMKQGTIEDCVSADEVTISDLYARAMEETQR